MAAEDKRISEYTVVASTGGAEFIEVVKGSGNFKRKNNFTASAAPTVTDDSAAEYSIGSMWHYEGAVWVCKDNAAGAAVWVRMGAILSDTLTVTEDDGVARVDLPYTNYIGLINQLGTDAPVLTEQHDNTGITFTPAYNDVGTFVIAMSEYPPVAKVNVSVQASQESKLVSARYREGDGILIATTDEGVTGNSLLLNSRIEIQIFP